MNQRLTTILSALLLVLVVVAVGYALRSGAAPAPVTTTTGGTTTWYDISFTTPSYPDDPAKHHGGLDDKLVALINRSEKTLDVADYDFDLKNVADAMALASKRGVAVRMVTDTDTLTNKDADIQAAFKTLKSATIPIVDDKRPAIMHDKFTVVDGEWVATGSWNYTDGDTYHLNNWAGVFHSRDLAANYSAEFEQMFSQRKFGPAKVKVTPHPSLLIDGHQVQNCFSPKGDCADLIVATIKGQTQKSLAFLAFSFTHDGIGQTMIDKGKSGVKVQGVFETTGSQTPFSEYGKMKKAGLDVYTDGNPWVMHHKVIILDDRVVVGGSFNFSANADNDNDENLLIFDDPAIATLFRAEFDRVLTVAKNPPAKKQGGGRESG
jgi:phosphatidylserine/phosphatidylglycerophosphate/cardiolipin synthase-like enzyme